MNPLLELIEIEEGYVTEVFSQTIFPGVKLVVYDNEDATLILGKNEICFDWTSDAKQLFEDIDVAEPIELLTILAECRTV